MKLLIVFLGIFAGVASAQTIYKVTKADGTVLYTDAPQEGAEAVELSSNTQNVADSLPVPAIPAITPDKPKINYQVSITSPSPDATLRNNNGNINISASAQPDFKGRYRLTFDGQSNWINSSGQFSLKEVPRGAHNYHVDIIDNKGKPLASTPQQTLFLHQASALINRN